MKLTRQRAAEVVYMLCVCEHQPCIWASLFWSCSVINTCQERAFPPTDVKPDRSEVDQFPRVWNIWRNVFCLLCMISLAPLVSKNPPKGKDSELLVKRAVCLVYACWLDDHVRHLEFGNVLVMPVIILSKSHIVQELCESRGGCPRLPVLMSLWFPWT